MLHASLTKSRLTIPRQLLTYDIDRPQQFCHISGCQAMPFLCLCSCRACSRTAGTKQLLELTVIAFPAETARSLCLAAVFIVIQV